MCDMLWNMLFIIWTTLLHDAALLAVLCLILSYLLEAEEEVSDPTEANLEYDVVEETADDAVRHIRFLYISAITMERLEEEMRMRPEEDCIVAVKLSVHYRPCPY